MQCERLLNLTKTWYLSVQNETMAPARMIAFIKKHAETCEICLADPDLKDEIAKITEIVLPESKIPKATRQEQQVEEDEELNDEEEEQEDDSEEEEDNELDDEEDDEI